MKTADSLSFSAALNISEKRSVTWQTVLRLIAVACLPAGLMWDISWHLSIGRDTFWTPAHLTIQFGGVVPALLAFWDAVRTTFYGTDADRKARVKLWGLYGSFGGWVTIWGAAMMVTSAPFDDWWHNTYGLDVKIVSPPHAVLGLGMFAVMLGVLLTLLLEQNRSSDQDRKPLALIYTIGGGLVVTMLSIYMTEFSWPNHQRGSTFYRVICTSFPLLLAMIARSSKVRWAATIAAGTYLCVLCLFVWGLPLFAAQPKLAPIYNPITHMVPPPFPMLIIVPAVAIDLIMRFWQRSTAPTYQWLKDWGLAFILAAVYLGLMLPIQWNFSKFLLSPGADNWFFSGMRHWPYYVELDGWHTRFWDLEKDPLRIAGVVRAFCVAVLTTRLGLGVGRWMIRVKR